MLMFYQEQDKDKVNRAVRQALGLGLADAASVKTLLYTYSESRHFSGNLTADQLPRKLRLDAGEWVKPADVSVYNRLISDIVLKGGEHGGL